MCSPERLADARPRVWVRGLLLFVLLIRGSGELGFARMCWSKTVKVALSGEQSKYVARTQGMSMCGGSYDQILRSHHIVNIETLHPFACHHTSTSHEESSPQGGEPRFAKLCIFASLAVDGKNGTESPRPTGTM